MLSRENFLKINYKKIQTHFKKFWLRIEKAFWASFWLKIKVNSV